ncbi:hypothetical protein EIP91_007276 [Steccherinum ochraceum]|uniref:Exosome complex protein n=1 Tax=Steccherinum ochraceum TaxID=92696 RepID=A0A4R0REW2_9APHY|nr:hypothetical protein EIP91_007276 [Steccherinum ochraceum]
MAEKIRSKLNVLNGSLDELEEKLESLFTQTLPETLAGLEPLQQAKLQVDIPYIVYDLIFIYLKTCGVDPKTHPVIAELDRVRKYFDKIKRAEEGPEKRKTVVDQGAANRFIKHAIAQLNVQRPPGDNEAGPSTSTGSAVRVPVKVTSKMAARAEYEKELKETGEEEESDLEVFDDEEAQAPVPVAAADEDVEMAEPVTSSGKGKGKAKAPSGSPQVLTSTAGVGKKRRRPVMDPFAGYGDSPAGSGTEGAAGDKNTSGQSTPVAGSETGGAIKDEKKAAKKARKKAKRLSSG